MSLLQEEAPKSSESFYELIDSISDLDPLPILRVNYLVRELTVQGTLDNINTNRQLIDRLKGCVIQKADKILPHNIEMYTAYDVDTSLPYDIPRAKALAMMELGILPKDTKLLTKYRLGNLFFYIPLTEVLAPLFTTSQVQLYSIKDTNTVLSATTGIHTEPNLGFHLAKYDGLETTLAKALSSPSTRLLNTFSLLKEEDADFLDIPL